MLPIRHLTGESINCSPRPTDRQFIWRLNSFLDLASVPILDFQPDNERRFLVWFPRHELAAHGEVEDGLAQGLDLVGARGQRRQRVKGEAGVGLEGLGIGRFEAGEARRRQTVARRLAACPRRLQPVAQAHQFIDLGDDAVLFGERWEGKDQFSKCLAVYIWLAGSSRTVAELGPIKR